MNVLLMCDYSKYSWYASLLPSYFETKLLEVHKKYAKKLFCIWDVYIRANNCHLFFALNNFLWDTLGTKEHILSKLLAGFMVKALEKVAEIICNVKS